ncbi:MAG: hypothetical protein D6775_08880 [Caldilineae bacterium]|nr:MAG: hypothetical protein D6775_08880 [Caldilineae bacterium]
MKNRSDAKILDIRLLGAPELYVDDQPVQLETSKTLALLVYLLVRRGVHRRQALAELLWGEQGQARAARSLRRALWNIRRSLCPEGDGDRCPYVTITRRDVAFNSNSPHRLDARDFEQEVRAIVSKTASTISPPTEACERLSAAVALYRGDFMEGLTFDDAPEFENWLLGQRAYFRELALQASSHLSGLYVRRGEYEQAILVLQRLLNLAPWSEWAHRQLMFCYAMAGRRADALAQYERCRHLLHRDLNVEPLPETVRLYERIRDPRQFVRLLSYPQEHGHAANAPELPPMPFLGRSREHAWLLARWADSGGSLTLVQGEAGIGKTRLVREVLRSLEARSVSVLVGRCYAFGKSIPFHPIIEALREQWQRRPRDFADLAPVWLSELSRLLPEIRAAHPDLPAPVPVERSATARQRLFEAVAQGLLAIRDAGLAFFVDDVHWADADTVDMLRYLLQRLRDEDIWFVAAYRAEELHPAHPFRLLRRELGQAHSLATLRLQPLTQHNLEDLVKQWQGISPARSQALAEYLYATSQGNPFILIECTRDLVEKGLLEQHQGSWRVDGRWLSRARYLQQTPRRGRPDTVPSAVRHMILARVERLPENTQALLYLAVVLGEPFTRELLLRTAEMPAAEVDTALSVCLARGLVRVVDTEPMPRYDVAHPLIRQSIYEHLAPSQRQRLHARIASVLEGQYHDREDRILEALAYHYAESGQRARAITYLLRAGDQAGRRQAQAAAIYFFSRALDYMPEDEVETRYRALSGRERAYNQLAQRDEQARDLDALWQMAVHLGDEQRQADVLVRRAEWALRTSRFREGIAHAREARRLALKQGAFGLAVDALRLASMCHTRVGDMIKARDRCLDGLDLARKVGDQRREMLCLGTLGIIQMDLGQVQEAREYMETALAYWRRKDELWYYAIACNNLSMLYHRLGDYGRGLRLLHEARDLIPRTGDLGLDAYSLTSLGVLYHTIGRYEDALSCYVHALELARIIPDQGLTSYIKSCQGDTYLALADVEAARKSLQEALAIEEKMDIRFYRPQIWEGLARCALAQGDLAEAGHCLEHAWESHQQGQIPGRITTLALLAHLHLLQQEPGQARAYVAQFHALAKSESREMPEAESWWTVVQVEKALGEEEQARQDLRFVYRLIKQRAETLDRADRRTYLNRVPAHRAIVAAMGCFPSGGEIRVNCQLGGAQASRALRNEAENGSRRTGTLAECPPNDVT